MSRFPPRYYPRTLYYALLLSLSWVLNGAFASAAVAFVALMVAFTVMAELVYRASGFEAHKKESVVKTAAIMAAVAAVFLFDWVVSGDGEPDLQRAFFLVMLFVQCPLIHVEHNRRVAQARERKERGAVPSERQGP